uniref:Uncharacterized protein n=1 Tax=Cyclophora tenuis TaxID=216820 RepID=A0A7S1D771_CYCTE
MSVDDICFLFSETRNPEEIELTFLRYVGPLYPQKQQQQKQEQKQQHLDDMDDTASIHTHGAVVLQTSSSRSSSRSSRGRNHKRESRNQKRGQSRERRFKWFGRQKRT